jgi:diguanylate cyclase (GGDEF)-like protein
MRKYKNLSLSNRGIKYKLKIAFYLVYILPLLIYVYVVSNYILPYVGLKLNITLPFLSIIIALLGFWVIKEVSDHVLSVSSEAKLIADGDIDRRLDIERSDEIGDLNRALNQLTARIRNDMNELKSYREKTSEINLEIQRHVSTLSNLLQISYLISQDTRLEEILKLVTEKSRLLSESDLAYLFLREETTDVFHLKEADGINAQDISNIEIKPEDEIFHALVKAHKPLILDQDNPLQASLAAYFLEKFKLKNTLVLAIYLKGRISAILGIGNNRDTFSYKNDDMKFLDIFAKQVAIALENDILVRRLEKLEIKDPLTGLYNDTFIRGRLDEEIKRAIIHQRPCAFVILSINNFQDFRKNFGSLESETNLKKVAFLIRDAVTEIDRVARIQDAEFAIVLPEKSKRQAQRVAEEIKKKIESTFSQEPDINKRLAVTAGVSENPLDGVRAEELISKAKEALKL